MPYEMCQGQQVRDREKRRSLAADKNSLLRMTFTVQEPNVCRRVMEIIQFGKFAKKSEKTSGENVDNICGT